jgi:PadR family transcriptional regulator PadR
MPYSIVIRTILFISNIGTVGRPSQQQKRKERGSMSFQIGSTLLDACVLSVLAKGDTYGYVLTQTMKQAIDISESTLYPVLRRLQKEGHLRTYDEPFQGRNRRYYAITETGTGKYLEYKQEWTEYKTKLNSLINGGEDSE